jgi:hypothetical protein
LHYACLAGSLEIACYILGQDPDQRRLSEQGLEHTRLALDAQSHSHRILTLLFDDFSFPVEGVSQAIELALRNHDRLSSAHLVTILIPMSVTG